MATCIFLLEMLTERRGHTHTHTQISNVQKLHGVSVEGCRVNQSLGWLGGGRCIQEEEEEGGCDALQQRDG